jgi:hypothetical protein
MLIISELLALFVLFLMFDRTCEFAQQPFQNANERIEFLALFTLTISLLTTIFIKQMHHRGGTNNAHA